MSMAPAFSSPAPSRTRSPRSGSAAAAPSSACSEQCSLHIPPMIPSSSGFGSTPEAATDLVVLAPRESDLAQGRIVGRARSRVGSELGPVAGGAGHRHATPTVASSDCPERRTPSVPPSSASEQRSGWGMSATTLPPLVADAGDARDRAVRVGRRRHAARRRRSSGRRRGPPLRARRGARVGVVVALAVGDRHPQDALAVGRRGERRLPPLDAQVDPLAVEREVRVPEHRSRQQAGLEQDLEAVADPEHRDASRGSRPHRAP